MIYLPTRMTGFMLVFGIFFIVSCSTFSRTTDTAETLLEAERYSAALEAVEKEIRKNPDDNSAKLLKAKILKAYATEQYEPENRETVYSNLRNTTEQLNNTSDQYKSSTDSLLRTAWMHEQSEGIRFLQQDDSDNFDEYFNRIIAHFNNAITIIPDSSVTYNLKATTYYRHGNLPDAISTLEQFEEDGFSQTTEMSEKLAYLYLEAGQIERSISTYEALTENNPDSEAFQQGLVNSYILGERHEESVILLENLAEKYPNRPQYLEALATERFYIIENDLQGLINASPESKYTASELTSLIERLNQISETYEEVDGKLPASQERQKRIATFHTKTADYLKELAPFSEDSVNEILSDEIEKHLKGSIPYWRELFEANTDVSAYARRLIRVYNELGMEQEAELLEQQINI